MSFTREELEVFGLGWNQVKGVLDSGKYRFLGVHDLASLWDDPSWVGHASLARLALAHPGRAELALGKGWSVAPKAMIANFHLYIDDGRIIYAVRAFGDDREVGIGIYTDADHEDSAGCADVMQVPPEFDAALSRARKIDAALRHIKKGKQG